MSELDYKEILRDLVLEKGVVDIIIDYKEQMEDYMNEFFHNKINWFVDWDIKLDYQCSICNEKQSENNKNYYRLNDTTILENNYLCSSCRNFLDFSAI